MEEIERLDQETLETLQEGGFVIHRSTAPYGAVSPDLACEQTLMASIKGKSGLTRGRGFTELNHLTWVLSRPIVCKLNEKISAMTATSIGGSIGQSSVKACRESRISRDMEDMLKIKKYFDERLVFDSYVVSTRLRNITTGLIAPDSVNVQDAFLVGSQILKSLEGQNPLTAKIPKETLVKQFPSTAVISNRNKDNLKDASVLDPNLLFQRALSLSTSSELDLTLEKCLAYELSPYPLSIFDECGFLRSGNKADLASYLLEKYDSFVSLDKECAMILDGGALLHRIPWNKGSSFKDITGSYLTYLTSNFLSVDTMTVVFDGYQSSTKDHTHKKRQPIRGMEIQFDGESKLLCKKATFLSNPINKSRFVRMLSESLKRADVRVLECAADADVSIVTTAMQEVQQMNTTVVGDDTDLLVLLIHYVYQAGKLSHKMNLYRAGSDSCVDITLLLDKMPSHLVQCILAVHAASGCDTASATFGMGKTKLLKICEKGNPLEEKLKCLYQSVGNIDKPSLLDAGINLLMELYGKQRKHSSLEGLRLW